MAQNKVEWTFPAPGKLWLRIEALCVAVFSVLIFLYVYGNTQKILSGISFTLIFVGIYIIIAYIISHIRQAEQRFTVTPTHLEIRQKTRFKEKNDKIPLKQISKHKLDQRFLGGYLITDVKKHLLFFNNKEEIKRYEQHLQKHAKSLVTKKKRTPTEKRK